MGISYDLLLPIACPASPAQIFEPGLDFFIELY